MHRLPNIRSLVVPCDLICMHDGRDTGMALFSMDADTQKLKYSEINDTWIVHCSVGLFV